MKTLSKMLFTALLAVSMSALAGVEKLGNLEVNYNVITTDTLTPAIAKVYGIERSPRRGMLTVAVTEPQASGPSRHVETDVAASAVNLIDQVMTVKMRGIREGNAVYYIGDFRIAPPDTLRFTLKVGAGKTHKIEFQKNFPAP